MFGPNYVCDGRKYISYSKFKSNANNHDAGIYNLKNKRFLMVNECCENSRLDENFIKNLSDSVHFQTGRKFQSGSEFFFKLYANVIIACNHNKFFKFDVNDENVLKRMLAVEMQSKFISSLQHDDWENLIFKAENISDKFHLYKSSFIDILIHVGSRIEIIFSNINENVK